MSEEKRYELIEAWLAGELSGKPLQNFEAQLQTDEALAFEVEVVRDLSNLNSDSPRNQLRNTLTEIRGKQEKERSPIPIFWWLRNAAATLLLLVGAYFVFTHFTNNDPTEIVDKPTPTITDEDEDGVIDMLDLDDEPVEAVPPEVVKKEVEKMEKKPEIIPSPKDEIVNRKKEQIQYKLAPNVLQPEIAASQPVEIISSSSVVVSSTPPPVEYVPDYVSNPIPDILFFEPEHETTIEEDEADRHTDEEMERINRMANENIERSYEIVDGDTIEVLASVASAVLYVADVPEKRLNFLLENEKDIIETSAQESIIKLDSISFDTYYDDNFMGKFFFGGKFSNDVNSKVGFYIFSQNPYDYLNNEYLFFEEIAVDSNNQFSINPKIEMPSVSVPYYNMYAVFVDLETEQPVWIERVLVD